MNREASGLAAFVALALFICTLAILAAIGSSAVKSSRPYHVFTVEN